MIALRQFHSLENETITIKIPPEFQHYQQAEIIILPIENTPNKITSTEALIKQSAGAITDFPETGNAERKTDHAGFFNDLRNRHISIAPEIDITQLMDEMNDGLC